MLMLSGGAGFLQHHSAPLTKVIDERRNYDTIEVVVVAPAAERKVCAASTTAPKKKNRGDKLRGRKERKTLPIAKNEKKTQKRNKKKGKETHQTQLGEREREREKQNRKVE